MSFCDCEQPRDFKITNEQDADDKSFLIRCRVCGGKYGSVNIDELRDVLK